MKEEDEKILEDEDDNFQVVRNNKLDRLLK